MIGFHLRFSAVHCEWDDWVNGECTEACGTGIRNNTRAKLIEEEHGGTCFGQSSEIEECNTQPCAGIVLLYIHVIL